VKARSLVYLAVLALLAVSCGRGGRTAAQKSPAAPAGAQRFTVHIDGAADGFSGVFTAFFPDKLTVHPGDTVTFELPHVFNGQAHSVTMGTLVDAAVAKLITRIMTPRADAYLVASFVKPRVKHPRTFLFPPILRRQILNAVPANGQNVLVYVSSPVPALAKRLSSIRCRFIAYGFDRHVQRYLRGVCGSVRLQRGYQHDHFRQCRR